MNVAILGTRGMPANYGGFETFAEEISPRLNNGSLKITVYCEKCTNPLISYKGVDLRYSNYTKSKNPLLFYLQSIYLAAKDNEVLIVAGTGGSFFYFVPKLLGRKIITNIDGVESRRTKWSMLKRLYVKMSERVAIFASDILIADSKGIKDYIVQNYKIDENKISIIEYGAYLNNDCNLDLLNRYGLTQGGYYLVVSRIEPENNVKMIVDGYLLSDLEKPLVIVGNLINNEYVSSLHLQRGERVRFLGGIYDKDALDSIRLGCCAYLHGHSVGGTNPSLLEALGSGNISICHDNIFNREVTESRMFYFSTNQQLAEILNDFEKMDSAAILELKKIARGRIENYYNWENITSKYRKLLITDNSDPCC